MWYPRPMIGARWDNASRSLPDDGMSLIDNHVSWYYRCAVVNNQLIEVQPQTAVWIANNLG